MTTTAQGTRRVPDARRSDIPQIVAELVAAGEDIYEVTPIRATLEDAYLQVLERT